VKLLILTQYYPPEIGAPQTRLAATARELRELGHEVEVVTALPNYPQGRVFPEYRGKIYRREVMGGVTVHRLWLYGALGSGIARMLNYGSFALSSLVGLLRAERPDFLFVESPPLPLVLPAVVYGTLRSVPIIMNVADLWPDAVVEMGYMKPGVLLRLFQWLERWSYGRAAYVNALTEGIQESLLRVKGVPPEKVLYLPNGVDTQTFRPQAADDELKKSLGLAEKKIILYAGTMGLAHGLENVLHAAKVLEQETAIHFLFLGDGSERAQLERLQQEMGLKNVAFLDPVPLEQLPSYLSIAHCGMASLRDVSLFECARPSKIFPVLASGKPVIYVGRGEGARLVEAAAAGVVVPPGQPEALARVIVRLARDPELAAQLGSNGRKFMEENHQWSTLIAKWVAALARSRSLGTKPQLQHAQ